MDMRKLMGWMVALLVASTIFLTPNDASAVFKLGVDGMWVPVAAPSVEAGGFSQEPDHDMATFGAAGHALIGFDLFSTGLKLNYFSSGFEAEGGETERQNELDINAMARIQIPTTQLGFWAEGGLATTTDFETFGYNVGGAVEYAIFHTLLLDLNLGVMGQYMRLPEISVGSVDQVELTEVRGIVFLGVDFGI